MKPQTARRTFVDVSLGGVNITADISNDILSLSYNDKSSDEVDDLSVSIQNRTGKWMHNWFPQTGDVLHAKIVTENWTGTLDCGDFILDEADFSGWPLTVGLKALAMPVNSDFSEVERNRTWERAALRDIAQTMAGNSGVPLDYLASYNPTFPFVSQTDKSDKVFLDELCAKFGLTMKMYSNRIVIYDMAELEHAAPVMVLTPSDMLSFKAKSTITDSGYTACVAKYTNKDGEVLEYRYDTAGTTPKVYQLTTQLASLAEAERAAWAKLRELNAGEMTFDCTIPGNTQIAAGLCVTLTEDDFGRFSGKYFIDAAAHKVGGGYTTDLSMHKAVEL